MSEDSPVLAAALRYAARGWAVFPCSPETKAPLVAGDRDEHGKLIPRTGGEKKASHDLAQIRRWWGQHPAALIGVAMGKRSGLFAVDYDPRTEADGKVFTLDALKADVEAQIGTELPTTITAVTQSGGVHQYFAWPDDGGPDIGNRGNLPKHVDVRGEGGYVIMPPSRMASGKVYRWRHSPDTTPAAAAPAALVAVLREKGKGAEKPPPPEFVEDAPAPAVAAAASGNQVEDDIRKYVLAAFDSELTKLRGTGDGGRNNQLNASAFAIGSLVATGYLSLSMARAGLLDVASAWPNGEKSAGTIESGLGAGQGSARDLSEIRAKAEDRAQRYSGKPRGRVSAANTGAGRAAADAPASGPPDAGAASSPPPHPPMGANSEESSQMGGFPPDGPGETGGEGERHDHLAVWLPRTELGNAERWLMRHGRDFRFCAAMGWMAWDGQRWSREEADRRMMSSIYATVRAIGDEADWLAATGCITTDGVEDGQDSVIKWVGPEGNKKPVMASDTLRTWGRTSESAKAISAVRTLAQAFVTVKLEAFDADPMRLNLSNGTLVIHRRPATAIAGGTSSVELVPHRREDMITMLAPVHYLPHAEAPVYQAFLDRVQPDPAVRRFLHAWGGYSMTGDASEQKFAILHGALGANGKSTWMDLLADMLGDYSISVNIAVFMDEKIRSGASPSPDLAELPRKRMVRTSEPPRGLPFAEALVKLVTGGEPLAARHLNMPFFRFLPEFKITVGMNPVPQLSDDAAIWRRTQIVPWHVSIPEGERDSELKGKLRREMSGVLNLMIEGLLDWCDGGLPETEAVRDATKSIRDSLDPLGRFLKAATASEDGGRINSTTLYQVFKAWCVFAGEKEWTQIGFSKAMANRGIERIQSNTVHWVGLKLVRGVDDFVREDAGGKWRARTDSGDAHDDWEDISPERED